MWTLQMKKYKLVWGHYNSLSDNEFGFDRRLNDKIAEGWEVIPASFRIADTSSGDITKAAILLVKEIEES